MKILLSIFVIIAIAALVAFSILAMMSKTGGGLGLVKGKLSSCPSSPNCVCSEFLADKAHYIQPIHLQADKETDISTTLRNAITQLGGEVLLEREDYVAATFSSPVFGFVDDLEMRIDKNERTIHLRSASRVGYSDMGANAKRIEQLRQILR